MNAPAYSASATYSLGVLTLVPSSNTGQQGQVYACSTAINAPETFTPAHWTLLGNQYDIFYALFPFPRFNISKGWYNIGDQVWWKNHTYTAIQKSVVLSHAEKIQFYKTGNVPFQNVFPDDQVNGPLWWQDNGAYIVPAGNLLTQNPATYTLITQARNDLFLFGGTQLPANGTVYNDPTLAGWTFAIERGAMGTLDPGVDYNLILNGDGKTIGWQLIRPGDKFNGGEKFVLHFQPIISQTAPLNPFSSMTSKQIMTTFFTLGDNREQSVLQHYIAMVLFYLYYRVSPKEIPTTRYAAYNEAKAWIDSAMEGDVTTDLIGLQPPQGLRIRWGSNEKLQNSY